MTASFRGVRAAVEAQAGRPVGQAVVTVPARFLASQRVALRSAVLAAGFADVHLINDAMAAVLEGVAPDLPSSTALVFSSGYAGFEVGLIRAVRGHYRALGYDGWQVPAGQALDECVLLAMFDALAE